MARSLVLSILACILLAGCTESNAPPPDDAQPTSTETETRTSTSQPTLVSTPELPLEAFLTGCSSWTTMVGGPAELFGGPLPEAWEPLSTPVFQLVQFSECERLSWGAFERGPVHLVFEFSEDFIAPEECQQGDFGRSHILRALWIDDPEVGAWLAATYGLPVRIATIVVDRVDNAVTVETWTWAEQGDATSQMHFQYGVPRSEPSTYVHRLYWFGQDAVSYMDFSETSASDNGASRASAGVLNEPTIYASWTGLTEYAGVTDRYYDLDTAISIRTFDDFRCTTN